MKLADHIGDLPHVQQRMTDPYKRGFNMSEYALTQDGWLPVDPNEAHVCKTICCIAGEAVRLFAPKEFHYDCNWVETARAALCIDFNDAQELFGGDFAPNDSMYAITPNQAADGIRKVAKKYMNRIAYDVYNYVDTIDTA
jgi:hypothetical protein